jgi:hypothetical protein
MEGRPTVMGSLELPDQDASPGGNAKPWGPTILTTTVAMLLEASGSGVGSGGWELTRGLTAASLDVPSGKQQTCSTRVAVTHAHIPEPADHTSGSPLQVINTTPWPWPWRLTLTQRTDLVRTKE